MLAQSDPPVVTAWVVVVVALGKGVVVEGARGEVVAVVDVARCCEVVVVVDEAPWEGAAAVEVPRDCEVVVVVAAALLGCDVVAEFPVP